VTLHIAPEKERLQESNLIMKAKEQNMKNRRWIRTAVFSAGVTSMVLTIGCYPSSKTTSQSSPAQSTSSSAEVLREPLTQSNSGGATGSATESLDSEHGHKPGAHGGIMVSLGRDSYHVEAVVDSEGSILLYTLGQDETRVIDVESQTLKGFVKAEGDTDSQSIAFEPSPQDGDSPNKTSLFVGKLPKELVGRQLDVTIPNIRIAGERFRLGFQTGQESHGEMAGMPDKVDNDEEAKLYLTAGGRYTAADIAANGNMTATQKFKGIKSAHDMHPKAGDRICPITETKANPKFAWVVDGKSYQFCCPPCIDEFLKAAKSSTDALPDPEEFIKK
jgi:YHS domain-containing protein